MTIHKANKRDFEEVFRLLESLWPDERLNKKKIQEIYNLQIKLGKNFLLAKVNKEYVGLITVKIKSDIQNCGNVGLIEELVVLDRYQGKGIGKKLMLSAMNIAKRKKCVEIQLYSSFKRKKAHEFYKRLGFKNTAYLFWKEIK